MSRPPAGAGPAEPARYELRGQGVLDARWSAWFEGLELSSDQAGRTIIAGPVVDQAALHGLLAKLRDLGLPLLEAAASTPTADLPGGSHAPSSHPDAPTRTQRSQRLRVTRQRQRGRRSTTPIDRRTPSGRLLAY